MIDMLKRHEIQVLRRAGHAQVEVAKLAGVSLGSVRRVAREPDVTDIDIGEERARREIGRPAKAEPLRSLKVLGSRSRSSLRWPFQLRISWFAREV